MVRKGVVRGELDELVVVPDGLVVLLARQPARVDRPHQRLVVDAQQREVASLWHPTGAADETPLVERSGAVVLLPSARSTTGGAHVGDTTSATPRAIRFPDDLLRRHHLYVARTRMGKSTLMRHLVAHKLRGKAAGRDGDAIIVVDPHADLVGGLVEDVPESLVDQVRLVDLASEERAPGINLLDTSVFSDRDRTADSVVRVARGLWEQWGPRMQSILEQTVKTLHEANAHPATPADAQHTISSATWTTPPPSTPSSPSSPARLAPGGGRWCSSTRPAAPPATFPTAACPPARAAHARPTPTRPASCAAEA